MRLCKLFLQFLMMQVVHLQVVLEDDRIHIVDVLVLLLVGMMILFW